MSVSTINQELFYVRKSGDWVECYKSLKGIFRLEWREGEYKAGVLLNDLTVVYLIENKLWDGLYIRNSTIENLAFLFMLKTVDRIGVKRCLRRVAPPDKERPEIFLAIRQTGLVTFYKGFCGLLNEVDVYPHKQFLALKKQYTHCYYLPGDNGIALYLRNNHLATLVARKLREDGAKMKRKKTA